MGGILSVSCKYAIACALLVSICNGGITQELYKAPEKGTHTRWVSPENPTGGKGQGAKTNKGAKGNAFYIIAPGEKKIIFDVTGAGVIRKMWMSGSIAVNPEQRRAVRIDMYWDGAARPAVSAPIGDFFGSGLSVMTSFESELFSNPESRSFNCMVPMPFRKSARIELTNESSSHVLYWYDIDYLQLEKPIPDALYFHAYWSRSMQTALGQDFQILPRVAGKGRYLGVNMGVIGNPDYNGTWFGEGIVKIYLDGDGQHPTLVNTGTEDYIGTGWGQGTFTGRFQGSLLSDIKNDLYSFYRYHTVDPVYFHNDCAVTIQQMGSAKPEKLREMIGKNAKLIPVWALDAKGVQNFINMKDKTPEHIRLLDNGNTADVLSGDLPVAAINYYRSDDVSATAYFYLDKPSSDLPALAPLAIRLQDMQEKVWKKAPPQKSGH